MNDALSIYKNNRVNVNVSICLIKRLPKLSLGKYY